MIGPEEILSEHGLSRTQCRVDILSIILSANAAVSDTHLRDELRGWYDRVTLFRTLRTFVQRGVLHCIPVDGGDVRYALSGQDHALSGAHVHFHCSSCTNVFCMSGVNLPKPMLPEGFSVNNCEVIVNGVCKECAS